MGQAKKRGSFEERKAQASARNKLASEARHREYLAAEVAKTPEQRVAEARIRMSA